MKLTGNDCVQQVYYCGSAGEVQISYGEQVFGSDRLRTAKRDGRGTKFKNLS